MSAKPTCFLCQRMVNDFVIFSGVPGYDSRFDSTLPCEESLRICVCDSCLAANPKNVKIVRVEKRKPSVTVKAWSPTYDCNDPRGRP